MTLLEKEEKAKHNKRAYIMILEVVLFEAKSVRPTSMYLVCIEAKILLSSNQPGNV